MKIYIAGKITGLVYEDALRAFAEAEAELERLGHVAVNPMKIETAPDLDWAEYMKRDIPHLLACDAIYLLPNWKESKGARLEKHIAEELGMLILTAGFKGRRGEIFPVCKDCGFVLEESDTDASVYECGECRRKIERLTTESTENTEFPDTWINYVVASCGEKFIQTDPEAEVDLCPKCEAALLRVLCG